MRHPDAREALEAWHRIARHAAWESLAETRAVYPHADRVGNYTVFNVRGNRYRLVVRIEYALQIIYVRSILTHNKYDEESWK